MIYKVDRTESDGQARILRINVGTATGPRGPGTAFVHMSIPGNLQPGVGQVPLRFNRAVNIASIYVDIPPDNEPVGDDAIFDVNLDGTTMFTNQANRPKVLDGQNEGAAVVPDITFVPAGGKVTVDVDQVGSVVAGANALVTIEYY
jgi:hypothetical protein